MTAVPRTLRFAAALAAGLALVAGPAAAFPADAGPHPSTTTPRPDDAVVPPGGLGAPTLPAADQRPAADGPVVIDVLVGYTAAAEAAALQGLPDLIERINFGFSDANAAFARSGINVRLNLVGIAKGIGTDPADGGIMLGQLVDRADGQWDNLTALMERDHVDLLSVYTGSMEVCGQAYYPGAWGSEYAYSVINTQCAIGINHDFAHEIGHNLGAAHERASAGPGVPEPAYGYGYTHINRSNPDASFRTIMSYGKECYDPTIYVYCRWIGYFSNPQVRYLGQATGIPIGRPDAADNRTAINRWAPTVAAYRTLPNARVRGDWTGEGHVDLLGRNANGKLYLYRGNGTGSVQSGTEVAGTWGGYNYLGSPGDVTGDGRTDLIGRNSAGTMFLFPGLGRGQLGPAKQTGTSWGAMNALATPGDMDLDGRPDLVARRSDNTLHTYTFRADGTMRYVAQIGSGWGQMKWIIGMGDLSGDRRGDVVGVNVTDGCLYAYTTKVTGGLPRLSLKGKVGCGWKSMTWLTSSGDINGDDLGDLSARRSDGTLWFYPGRSGGGVRSGIQVGNGWNGMASIL